MWKTKKNMSLEENNGDTKNLFEGELTSNNNNNNNNKKQLCCFVTNVLSH
jgi:hypothetical protein